MTRMIRVDASVLDLLKEMRADQKEIKRQLAQARITTRPEWMTFRDAATTLHLKPDSIRRKIKSSVLQANGTGKPRMVRLAG